MCEFTDEELRILELSTHARAMYLLDLSNQMSQKGYMSPCGKEPTIDDIRAVEGAYEIHLDLEAAKEVLG